VTQAERTVVVLPPIANGAEAMRQLGLERVGIAHPHVHLFPGQGGRERQEGFRFGDLADEVAAEHPGPVHVVALAIGAYTAAELLLRYPDRVASLFVASSSIGPVDDDARLRDAARGRQALETGMEPLVDDTVSRWFTPAAVAWDHPGVRYARAQLSAMQPAAWNDIWSAIAARATVAPDAAARLSPPVSIVVPTRDVTGAALTLPPLHDQIPRSRLVFVDGPHMLGLERPESLRAAIEEHFAWVEAGGQRVEQPVGYHPVGG
jgi:pimeloyl-ACP methyl ester carboxylesterase